MKIEVATKWKDLNKWQLEEVVDLLLNMKKTNYEFTLKQMVVIIFQKEKGFLNRLKLRKILWNVPISELFPYVEFLLKEPEPFAFPEIKELLKPADKLTDLSIKQFGIIDQFFHAWMETKNESFLRGLVSAIYRNGEKFDEKKIIDIAKITDKLSKKEKQVIGFAYMTSFHFIGNSFPVVFPPQKPDSNKPSKKVKHKPFSEVIINMAMNEQQPLGNFHECNDTKIYDFMNVLTKVITQQEKLNKEHGR